jgi:hypothetical protein
MATTSLYPHPSANNRGVALTETVSQRSSETPLTDNTKIRAMA